MLAINILERKQRRMTYLLFHLLIFPCYAFELDNLYFSSFSDETSFRKFCPVSLSQCIHECKIRSRCEAITYSNTWKMCSLLSYPPLKSEEAGAGIVGANKSDWDMTTYEFCSICVENEVCNISTDASATCQIEECRTPVMPENTMIYGNIYNVGAKVCYDCLDGYVNIGGYRNCSVCSGTGEWTSVDIECSVLDLPFECDTDWIKYEGHCYLRVTSGWKWTFAMSNCMNLGGFLLEIETAAENTFIGSAFPSGDYWIGGSDLVQEGTFIWCSGNPLTFTAWLSGEPNGGNSENCIRIDTAGKWRDKSCSWALHSICEKQPSL